MSQPPSQATEHDALQRLEEALDMVDDWIMESEMADDLACRIIPTADLLALRRTLAPPRVIPSDSPGT